MDDELDLLDAYFNLLEDIVFSASMATSEDFQHLWLDGVSRFVDELPPFPEFDSLLTGPRPESAYVEAMLPPSSSAPWTKSSNHKWLICAGAVTFGGLLLAGYLASRTERPNKKRPITSNALPMRNRVIVVLGGDTPLALPLITALELEGFIVIATVSTMKAGISLEARCNGFVKALLLNPEQPNSVASFLNSLHSALSIRFPIDGTSAPNSASPATHPYVHSLISLLTLTSPLKLPTLHLSRSPPSRITAFERIALTSSYIPYHTYTHVTSLQAIQAVLPLFRLSHPRARARARDSRGKYEPKRSIVVCVPKIDALDPRAAAQTMSAAATACGVDFLRREIRSAGKHAVMYEDMQDVRVRTVDVNIGSYEFSPSPDLHSPSDGSEAAGFTQVDVDKFVGTLVDVVGGRRYSKPTIQGILPNSCGNSITRIGLKLHSWSYEIRDFIRGDRFCIGGSALPPFLLKPWIGLSRFIHLSAFRLRYSFQRVCWALSRTFERGAHPSTCGSSKPRPASVTNQALRSRKVPARDVASHHVPDHSRAEANSLSVSSSSHTSSPTGSMSALGHVESDGEEPDASSLEIGLGTDGSWVSLQDRKADDTWTQSI